MLQANAPHDLFDIRRGAYGAVVRFALHQFAGRTPMRLDIVDLETQSLKSEQIMHRLPGNTGHREMAQKTEQYNLVAADDIHASCSEFGAPGLSRLRLVAICASSSCL